MKARPLRTSEAIIHDMGTVLAYQGQRVRFEWQS